MIFMTIVIKIRNDLERSGDVPAARKKARDKQQKFGDCLAPDKK
jgi:hypothetical protein